eukprot:851198-Rhodomonas_salina.1
MSGTEIAQGTMQFPVLRCAIISEGCNCATDPERRSVGYYGVVDHERNEVVLSVKGTSNIQ